MAAPIEDPEQRKYPLSQPENWTPKVPKYTLRLPPYIDEIAVAYIGVQSHAEGVSPQDLAYRIDEWRSSSDLKPVAWEKFHVEFGRDRPGSIVYALYWSSHDAMHASLKEFGLRKQYDVITATAAHPDKVGLWLEWLTPELDCFETNYMGTDYSPGISAAERRLGAHREGHSLTGYWGAARDRLRASAYDKLDDSESDRSTGSEGSRVSFAYPALPKFKYRSHPDFAQPTLGIHLRGSNLHTHAHIRSGQFWQNCTSEESISYEQDLEPHLLNGLRDVLSHPIEKGDYGLRFLRNTPAVAVSLDHSDEEKRKETCAIALFRTLRDMESWAKDCPSHHKIFDGATKHREKYGDEGLFRTWHEVCVLKPGQFGVEYINCDPATGVLPFLEVGEMKTQKV